MIKRFGKLLLLALIVLFLLPTGVLADEIKSWADYHFESKPKPSGVLLYDSEEPLWKETSDYKVWNLPSGSYKVLSYSPAKNTLYGTELVERKDELGTYSERVLKAYTNVVDLATVLTHEGVSSGAGDGYYTCTDTDGYALFFKDTAKSVDDLLFVCKVADLSKYATEKSADTDSYSNKSKTANSNISLVSKLNSSGTESKLKLAYNLGTVSINNEKVVEKGGVLFFNGMEFSIADTNGVFEFTATGLTNKTYTYEVESLNGFRYKGTFKVDFVTSDDSSDSFEDELAEEKAFDKIPDREPKVKITGFPKKSTQRGIPVTLTLNSDIACDVNFNGRILNDEKAKTVKFDVSENGSYSYTVNTGKRVVNKVLEINFFDDTMSVADAVNAKLDTTGINTSTSDIKLAQTGIESNRPIFILAILLVSGVLISLVFITRKKGAKTDEEN